MTSREHTVLGDYLRARRELLRPQDAGLPAGQGRRRVPGLRREELALLAGISADYYLRLEQGRDRRPSPQVLDALAGALGLDEAARAHLHRLAKQEQQPRRRPRRAPERVVPGLRRLLESAFGAPAYVQGRLMDVLAANGLAQALSPAYAPGTNVVRAMFLEPGLAQTHGVGEHDLAGLVACLRRQVGPDVDDPRLTELVGELSVRSEPFRRLWARQDVRAPARGPLRLHHPQVGPLELHYEKLLVPDARDQQLVVLSAEPGSPSAEALTLLGALQGPGAHEYRRPTSADNQAP